MSRASYDTSGVVGVYTPGVSVVLTTNNVATIPVTGACSQSSCASYGGQFQDYVAMAANSTVTLSLTPTKGATLTSLSLNPPSVTGGTSSTGTVTLNGAAPTGGLSVTLSSDNASATVPASITVAGGSTTATFTVTTGTVGSSTSATITAGYNGVNKTALLTHYSGGRTLRRFAQSHQRHRRCIVDRNRHLERCSSDGWPLRYSVQQQRFCDRAGFGLGNRRKHEANFTVTTGTVGSSTSATITASYNSVNKSRVTHSNSARPHSL